LGWALRSAGKEGGEGAYACPGRCGEGVRGGGRTAGSYELGESTITSIRHANATV